MALCVVVVLSICLLCCYGVQAISKQSDHAILNELNLISVLPSTEDNDFDCVDIYKQPALSHPLLKNHKIQLSPRFSKRQIKSIESSRVGSPLEVSEQSKGCPLGKVPIRRSKSNHQFGRQFSQDFPGRHFATLDTTKTTTFHGARSLIAINKPPVSSDQYSMAQIWVQSGPTAELNIIQAGWAVHPQLYGDDRTHMTVRWTADAFKSTGCYNVQCSGFVQVDRTVHPGQLFQNISVPRGNQYLLDISIIQEQSSGKWWLMGQNNIRVGYWPKELFNHLGDGASIVRYGGTTSASAAGLSPQMGTGSFPSNNFTSGVGFFSQNKIMGSDFFMNDIVLAEMVKNVDTSTECYDLDDYGFLGPDVREILSYGGPGGASCGT